jgi:hypothetical protein
MSSKNGTGNRPLLPDYSSTAAHSSLQEDAGLQSLAGDILRLVHDFIPRRRDGNGNDLPWKYTSSIAVMHAKSIKETYLWDVIEELKKVDTMRACRIASYCDDRLIPAIRIAVDTYNEERKLLREQNEAIRNGNEHATKQCASILKRMADATAADELERSKLEAKVDNAHISASAAVATTGHFFDPKGTPVDDILSHEVLDHRVIEANEGIASVESDKHIHRPWWVVALLSLAVGPTTGISIGVKMHILHSDTITHDLRVTAACSFVGIASMWMAKYVHGSAWHLAAQARFVATNWWQKYATSGLATLLGAAFLGADMSAEWSLFTTFAVRAAKLQQPGVTNSSMATAVVLWLMSGLIAGGFLINAGLEGYTYGRHDALASKVVAQQDKQYRADETTIRTDPKTHAAFNAVAQYDRAVERLTACLDRITRKEAPFLSEASKWQSLLKEEQASLSDHAMLRVQDAIRNAQGAQATFDGMLTESINRWAPVNSSLHRWAGSLRRKS